jgi:hypothetical protein
MENLIEAQEGAPAQKFEPLEDGATYRVRFRNSDGPGKHTHVDMLHHSGYWVTGCEAYVEGPLRVADAGYEVVARLKPADDGAPAPKFDELEDGAIYRLCFRDFSGPGLHEFTNILHLARHWWSPNDGEMGPISVARAGYEVVANMGLPADLGAALGEVLPSADGKPARRARKIGKKRIPPAPCLFIQQKLLRRRLRAMAGEHRPSAARPGWQAPRGAPKPA